MAFLILTKGTGLLLTLMRYMVAEEDDCSAQLRMQR